MNYKSKFFYLETNALINLTNDVFTHLNNDSISTSSFALMEFLKSTNNKNFYYRKKRLQLILDSIKNIDWNTPIEKLLLMYDIVKIQDHRSYSLFLRPLINKIIKSESFDSLNKKLDKNLDVTIEEIDNTYLHINNLTQNFMIDDSFKESLEKALSCLECFFAINVQEHLNKKTNLSEQELFNRIVISYNGSADIFFNCCRYYFRTFSNYLPHRCFLSSKIPGNYHVGVRKISREIPGFYHRQTAGDASF